MLFFIKKTIEAKNLRDAIRREKEAELTDVWLNTDSIKENPSKIGFKNKKLKET